MSAPNYIVVTLDLAVARGPAEAIPGVNTGVKFDGVKVLQLPGGANVSLRFGPNGNDIPITSLEAFRFLDDCEHPFFCDEGLFITNAAGAGNLVLFISMGTTPGVQP